MSVYVSELKYYKNAPKICGRNVKWSHMIADTVEELHEFADRHDPSGIDMTRDVEERLSLFSRDSIGVIRLALNLDQIKILDPPANPAKETDSRAKKYIAEFGYKSWELDAVEPKKLDSLITDTVMNLLDKKKWKKAIQKENEMKLELKEFVEDYTVKAIKS